ncbi:hypothetical protein AAFO90_21900 [Phaeobacter sp. CAU 1743]|uniref:hypothetical protein n=1 Tax=Phaeobacter sp. CAU 1743 TaxID=3140367 RepID=UPI0023B3E225
MANRTTITTSPFTEPPMRAMFARFTALTASLVQLTDAERALGGYDRQDPALSAFTGAVDAARAATLTHCAVILSGETADEMIYGLQMTAKMVRAVLTTDKPAEVSIIRNLLAMRHETVLFTLYRRAHLRYNTLLDLAFDALAAHISLPETAGAAYPAMAGSASVAHTKMSYAFTSLLGAMYQFARAEQPLQRPAVGDVRADRFGVAMQEAEAALKDMYAALSRVMAADLTRREDKALWEMGYALYNLIAKDDDEARQSLFETLVDYQSYFMVQGNFAVARRTREMQVRFFHLVTALMSLQDFGGPGPDDDGACGPSLAA